MLNKDLEIILSKIEALESLEIEMEVDDPEIGLFLFTYFQEMKLKKVN